jgi:hypothetical protein
MDPISLQLMDPNCKPVYARAYTVPRSVEQQLRKEIVRLVDTGFLEEDYSSEWASPSFAIPKKNRTIRVVTDFRNLNLLLKRCMSPISYSKDWAADMIRSMEGFIFASALDLNMGYYYIKIDADAQKLCTIVFPWGKIQIQTLTHGYQVCPKCFSKRHFKAFPRYGIC